MSVVWFVLMELALLPFQIGALFVYVVRVRRQSNPARISGTANEPLTSRLIMHQAGTRKDAATARLAPHLPAYGPATAWLFESIGLAARLSGYTTSIAQFPVARPSTLKTMIGHRTEFFDRLLTEAIDLTAHPPPEQIVILGAGWDTRAWGLLADSELPIFEVDMRPTQQVKRAALQEAGLSLARVIFVEADFVENSWLNALNDRGFDPTRPAFFLWEGVTMYLTDAAVDSTLREVGNLTPGSRIAFDFLSRELIDAKAPFEKLGKWINMAMRFYYANEPFRYGVSTKRPARQHVEDVVRSQGLELVEYEPIGPEGAALGGLALASGSYEVCRNRGLAPSG